jgi:hypothetical protein
VTDPEVREPFDPDIHFDPKKVSPSRVNSLTECGVAFRMKYLEQLPEEVVGSAALFGNVFHAAAEKWSLNRSQDLLALMRQAWLDVTKEAPVVSQFLGEYQLISTEVLWAEHEAREKWEAEPRNKGKKSQAPRMTKYFKESDACKKLNRLLGQWIPKLNEGSPWRFNERDPLPALYDESLVLARRYEARWGHLPPSLHTEFAFDVPWRGFRLTGFIDAIDPLVDRETGDLIGVGVIDYKTYRKAPAEHKDWRQLVMYDVAVGYLREQGVLQLPEWVGESDVKVGIDYARWTDAWKDEEGEPFPPRRFWQITAEDHDALESELQSYSATVEQRNFLPAAKSTNPDFCNYGSLCCLRTRSSAGGCATPVEVNL